MVFLLQVSEVMEGALAGTGDRIQIGDRVVSVDGTSSATLSPQEAVKLMEDSSSSHMVVLTRTENDNEAPPAPQAPPPTLPVSAPPDIPLEKQEEDGVNEQELTTSDAIDIEIETVKTEMQDLNIDDENPDVLQDNMVETDKTESVETHPENGDNLDNQGGPGSYPTPASISVTIPDQAEVSSPQGSQDSGVDMPSPLQILPNVEEAVDKEKLTLNTGDQLSNGDLKQGQITILSVDYLLNFTKIILV